jgi:pimeloyl-ACP methyl ester carboxylesterase
MLSRSRRLPSGSGWSFELKWDGFRALVSTEDGLRVRRRGLHTSFVPEVCANGVSLYYEEHGTGEPLLLIHGTSGSAAVWGPDIGELARRGRTIVYDRRGCTRSERPEPYATSVHEQADDAAALIDALAAAPAVIIGRSYGGETAIDVALRHPDRVRALVLLEASVLSLSDSATHWAEAAKQRVYAAAERDMSTVAETLAADRRGRRSLGELSGGCEADVHRQRPSDNRGTSRGFSGGYGGAVKRH